MKITDMLPDIRTRTLPDHGSALVFVDPLTQQPYQEDTPPHFLLADPGMAQGFKYLETHGDKLAVHLLLRKHLTSEDLSSQNFAQRLEGSNYYAYEGYPHRRERILMTLGRLPLGNEYDRRHREAINSAATPGFSFDVTATRLGRRLQKNHLLHREEGNTHISYQFIREWQWVPTLGRQLSRRERAPQHTLRILMTAGLAHFDIERKLSLYGVDVTLDAATENHTNEETERYLAMAKCMRSGVIQIPPRDLGNESSAPTSGKT